MQPKMYKIVLLVLCVMFNEYQAVMYSFGSCPFVDPVLDFNMTDFLGVWHVIQKPIRRPQTCLKYNIRVAERSDNYEITSVEPYTSRLSGVRKELRSTGYLSVRHPAIPAIMDLTTSFSLKPTKVIVFMVGPNYAAFFTCKKWPVGHTWSAEILSRTPTLEESIIEKIRSRLSSFNIDVLKLSTVSQDDCTQHRQKENTTDAKNDATTVRETHVVEDIMGNIEDDYNNFDPTFVGN